MSFREILRLLKADGWYEIGHSGSHVQLKHADRQGRTTVPHSRADLPLGTRLPHDPEVAEVGVMLVTATLGAAGEVTLELSPEALRRADATAASSGRTRERVLSEKLERLFAAE